MNENLGHLMLDMETMGKRAGCAIVSIGAVEFNLETNKIGRQFYERVELQSCLDIGLFIEASTLYWWMQQNDAARQELCATPRSSIQLTLEKLTCFMKSLGDFKLWGNGASFDMPILNAAYFAIGVKGDLPWYFRNEMCVRTLVAFAPSIKENYPFAGVIHNPIDDCIHQISYCHAIWRYINNK